MNEYDAAFQAATGGNVNPYDAIMKGLMPQPARVQQPTADPAPDDRGAVNAALVGAGRTFDRLGAGLQQVFYGLTGNQPELDRLAVDQADKERLMMPLQKQHPLATAVGSALPAMAVPVGGAGVGLGGLMARAAVGGALPEALSYGSVEERAKNAALAGVGGAAGGALGYGLGKGLQTLGSGLRVDPQAKAAAQVLEANNIPVRPDQATGNRMLQNLNAALDNLPFTAGKQQAFRETQQTALNRAVGAKAMMPVDQLDDTARQAAKFAIGQEFTQLAGRNTVSQQATNALVGDLATIQADAARLGTSDTARIVTNAIDDVLAKVQSNGTIEGGAYRQLDSALGSLARRNKSGDVAHYVGQVRESLRNAMDNSISPADQAAWRAARQQYANLGNISNAVDESGNVSAKKLHTVLRNASRDITKTAKGDLADLSTAAKAIIPDQVPNSGTAQRALAQALLSGGGAVGGYLYGGGDLEQAALGAGGALAIPMLTRAIINNPRVVGAMTKPLLPLPRATAPTLGLLGAAGGYAAPSLLFPATAP